MCVCMCICVHMHMYIHIAEGLKILCTVIGTVEGAQLMFVDS